jgi:hypothetical protein
MMKSRGDRLKKNPSPFLGRYKEILITYDNNLLGVEADGLLPGGGWENIITAFDVNNPEEYAHGIYDSYANLFPTLNITIMPADLVSSEGWHLGDED